MLRYLFSGWPASGGSWERTLAPLHSGGEIGPTTLFGQRPRQRPGSAEMTDEGKACVPNARLSAREFTGG